jgi:uncharacterized membrane protein|nr:MAG TPA: Putative ABC-transporter type IV [Caudoviricetes sp.]
MQLKQILKLCVLALIGGITYMLIELVWRGYSHISMFILGSICFLLLGGINEFLPWELGFVWQMLIGAGIVTILELIFGIVVNVWLELEVWDYSNLPFNFMGQICLPFSFAWTLLSGVAIVVDDYLRYLLFGEEKPHYKIL